MSAVLARTWNYLSGLGQEPGWAVGHLISLEFASLQKLGIVVILLVWRYKFFILRSQVPSESSRHSLPTGLANWLQQVCIKFNLVVQLNRYHTEFVVCL